VCFCSHRVCALVHGFLGMLFLMVVPHFSLEQEQTGCEKGRSCMSAISLVYAPSPAKQVCVLACKAGEANACCWAHHAGANRTQKKVHHSKSCQGVGLPNSTRLLYHNCVPPKRRASSNACASCCAGTCSTVCHSQASASRLASWSWTAPNPLIHSYSNAGAAACLPHRAVCTGR